MDLGFNLAQSNRNLKHPTSRQIFGDTSGLLCKNDQILRRIVFAFQLIRAKEVRIDIEVKRSEEK